MNCISPSKMPRAGATGLRGSVLAISIAALLPSALADETWIGKGAGNWSDSTRWLDGSAPAAGGDDLLAVHFANVESASIAANLDLGIFSLNRLDFDARYASAFQITNAAGSALRFAGVDPSVSLRGLSSATISTPVVLAGPSPALRIEGNAAAALTFSGAIGEEAGPHGLAIEMNTVRADIGAVQLSGANTFSGGVELRSGNLFVNHASALGSGALTVRGGSLRLGAISLANHAVLHSGLVLADTAGATWSGVISSAVANTGLTMRGGGTLTLTGASTFSGETTLDNSLSPSNATGAGPRLTLNGGGSVQSSAFNIRAGSRLTIEAEAAGAANRVADTAPIRLRSGQLRFSDLTGNAIAKSETLGTVSLAGHSTIALAGGAAAISTLNVAGFSRTERGTLLVAGISTGAGNGRLFSTAAPGLAGGGGASGPTTSIVPWAIGDSGADLAGSSFVTYTAAGGFRLLNTATDFASTFVAGQNVRLASATTLAASVSVNSLWLAGGSLNGAGQTLTISSGALASSATTSISASLSFPAEAVISTVSGTLTLSGIVGGSNGLTKAGAGTLVFQSGNPFGGALTINAGLISFSALNQLGTNAGAIVFNGTGAGLSYTGANAVTLARPFALNTGIAAINNTGTNQLTLSGGTQGPGGWSLTNGASARTRLTGAAAHTGLTNLAGGTFAFASDAALGAGDLNIAGSTTLDISGAWSTGRRIAFTAATALKTNGFDVLWSGPLTGGGAIAKTTAGNVRIESLTGLASAISFDMGRLEIGGAGVLKSSSVTLTGGAALVLDNSAQADSDRFAGNGGITLRNAEVRLEGNATAQVTETLGSLTMDQTGAPGNEVISVTAPGTAGSVLKIGGLTFRLFSSLNTVSYPVALPPLLIRGTQLGGAAGSGFTRVLFASTVAGTSVTFQSNVIVDDMNGLTTSFAMYDTNADATGPRGYRPLEAAEYSSAISIQNPANGGATPTDAHLLLDGAGAATGANNFGQTLTLATGSALTLGTGQTLNLSRGSLIARAGGAPASIGGGTLDGGAAAVSLHLAGDLRLGASITTNAGQLRKFGAGALILESGSHLPATVMAHSGALRTGDAAALADSLVSLAPLSTLELTDPINVGGLAGIGAVQLGSHTLTIGTLPADCTFEGTVNGAGMLRIVDGGRSGAQRTLSTANNHSGGISLDSGVLVLGTAQALGTGPLIVNGGALAKSATPPSDITLDNPLVLNGTLDLRGRFILSPTITVSGSGTLSTRSTVRMQGLVDFPGSATVENPTTYSGSSPSGAYFLEGPAGSLRPRGGLVVNPDGRLYLDDTVAYAGAAGGRLADDVPVDLRSGTLELFNNASANLTVSESTGSLRFTGFSTLKLSANPNGSTTLAPARLERIGHGTFETINFAAAGLGTSFVKPTLAPATADGGVVPYAIGSTGGVILYDPALGLRGVTSGEYTTTIASATPASHLRIGSATNAAAITVRTLSLLGLDPLLSLGPSTLAGGGSIAVASGLVSATSGESKVDNTIHFGAAEGFIAVPSKSYTLVSFVRPVTGSGGLTIYGRGMVALAGGNQVSGPLAINGSARLLLTDGAQVGSDTSPIQIDGRDVGAGFQVNGGSVTVSRPIQVNSGNLAVAAPYGGELILTGPISGPGGIFAARGYSVVTNANNFGITILAGANSYTGPTIVESNLAITSDASLGNGGAIILAGGSLKLLGDWTTARRLERNDTGGGLALDTNGFNAAFSGLMANRGTGSPSFGKKGGGVFTILTAQDDYNGTIAVQAGQLALAESGRFRAGTVNVAAGAGMVIDNRAQVADRGGTSVSLSGGDFSVLGNATVPTSLRQAIYGAAGFSTVTLLAQPGVPVTFDGAGAGVGAGVSAAAGAYLLVRGDQLGIGASGGYTRFRSAGAPTLTNGLVPGVIVDTRATGGGVSFATYDTAQDAAGTIGLRPLNAAEFTGGSEIRNPANGGGTAVNANFLASGNVSPGGAANTLNTLTLDPGALLAMSAGQTLTLSQNAILVREGAPATITGGALLPSSSPLAILGGGELRLGTSIPAPRTLQMLGPGVLTVTAPQQKTTFTVSGGSLRAAAGDPLAQTRIQLDASGRLELAGIPTRIPELNGTGTIDLGGATLSITRKSPDGLQSSFAGAIIGAGTFEAEGDAQGFGITLTGASPFTGTLAVNGGLLHMQGTAPNVTGVVIRNGTLFLDNWDANSGAPRLASAPVTMSSGALQLNCAYGADTAATFGPLSGEGAVSIYINADSTSPNAIEGRLTFAGLARQNRGTFLFTTYTFFGANRAAFNFTSELSGLLIGNPAVPAQRPVLPFATIDGHVAAFEPGVGLRPLLASERSATFTPGANVQLTASTSAGNVTINSLETVGTSSVSGNGIVHVTSGVVTGNGGIDAALDFGAAEGLIFNLDSGVARYNGPISGTNGLTITTGRDYGVRLDGNNTFTGPLTLNGGRVLFRSAANLGADASPIVLRDGNLAFDGSGAFTLTRGLDLRGSSGVLSLAEGATGRWIVAGPITGTGGLVVGSDVTLTNSSNSYAGPTTIGGVARFASDAVFGQSPKLIAQGGVLNPSADWTTGRALQFGPHSSGTIDTGAFTSTLNGALNGTEQLTKSGAGRLIVNNGGEFTGPILVSAGALRLNGPLGASGNITVAAGARLEGNSVFNRPVALSGTLAPGASAGILEMGNLTLQGGSTLELELFSAAEFDQVRVDGTVTFNGLVQLALDFGGASFSTGIDFPFLLNDGTDPIGISPTKAFAIGANVLEENEIFFVGNQPVRITYAGGDGNDVSLSVPEPSAGAALMLGLCSLLVRRRRSRR